MEKSTYLEIPGNSSREFEDARFPGIPGNSRTGIPGGPGLALLGSVGWGWDWDAGSYGRVVFNLRPFIHGT